jgi:hypothetical protein
VIPRFDSAWCIDFASADDFADVLDEEDPTQGRCSLSLSLSLSFFPIPLYFMLTRYYLDGVRPFFIENTCVHVNCRGGGCATEEEDDDND